MLTSDERTSSCCCEPVVYGFFSKHGILSTLRGTQEMLREVNTRLKIPVPTIVTPEDFFEEEDV